MKKIVLASSLIISTLISINLSAQAFELIYSDNTKQLSSIIKFKTNINLPANLGFNGSIGIAPALGSIINTQDIDITTEESIVSQLEQILKSKSTWDVLLDLNLNLAYNYSPFDIDFSILGNLKPTISPYLGYRHLFTWTGAPEINLQDITNIKLKNFSTQLQGLNLGLKLETEFPLGLSAYVDGGGTVLINGNYSADQGIKVKDKNKKELPQNGNITTSSLFLPKLGVGVNWSVLSMAGVYAGYDLIFLPQDIRYTQNYLNGDKSMIHSFNVGLNFLFFSI